LYTELLANFIGAVMSVISFILWLPQAKLVWKNRNNPPALTGISNTTQVLVLVNAIGWGLYGFLTNSFWVGAPGLVNGPLAILILVILNRKQKTEPLTLTGEVSAQRNGPDYLVTFRYS
jgi:uncharacterized protein with PQ loop repeat